MNLSTFAEFESSRLTRNDFISLDPLITNKLNALSPLLFMPAGLTENNMKSIRDTDKYEYQITLFGTLKDGRSIPVNIYGIKPYIWVKLPNKNSDVRTKFIEKMMTLLRQASIEIFSTQIMRKKEFMGYDKNIYCLKITFVTNTGKKGRTAALRILKKEHYKTATDDGSGYYKVVMRDRGLTCSSWLNLKKYTLIDTSMIDYGKSKGHRFKDRYVLSIHVDDIEPVPEEVIISDPSLMKDKSLVMGWDIETITTTGDVPRPQNKEDKIFMICCVFQWHYETGQNQLLRICFVDQEVNPNPNFTSVICKNEAELIKGFATIIGMMQPEYITGFNDTGYDWPWVVQRAYKYKILDYMRDKMDRVPCYYGIGRKDNYNVWKDKIKRTHDYGRLVSDKIKNVYNHYVSYRIYPYKHEKTKISAEDMFHGYFLQYNGYIAFDTRAVFMQLNPTAEKTSLNYFLKINNLDSKEDMPYQDMFKIYWQAEHRKTGVQIPEIFADYSGSGDIKKEMTDVAKYCIVDAQRCCELVRKRNVIPDKREMANLSFTSVYDSFYRAGAMKVINIVIEEGQKRNYVFSTRSSKKMDDEKYPGALVILPKTGLYSPKLTLKERIEKSSEFVKNKGKNYNDNNTTLRKLSYSEMLSMEDLVPKIDAVNDAIFELNSPAVNLTNEEASEVLTLAESKYGSFSPDDRVIFNSYLKEDTHRPVSGLDYKSLYPHIIMTYNFSPEMMICMRTCNQSMDVMIQEVQRALDKGEKLHRVEFKYGQSKVRGFSVLHNNKIDMNGGKENKFGIYPTVLRKLYMKRKMMKKPKNMYESLVEHYEDVVNTVDKKNQVVEFVAEHDITGLTVDDLIKLNPAFTVCKKDTSDFTKWKKQIPPKGFSKSYILDFLGNSNNVQKILGITSDYVSFSDIECSFAYFNAKQLALKIMMNTLYGVSGNKINPFYILTLAGGITTAGRENLMLAADIAKQHGYRVNYGDTDSIYIETPNKCFSEIDKMYYSGRMTKLEYCQKQINITFEEIPKIKQTINSALEKDNGTKFLEMDYEESLYPCVLLSKKKYYGLPHTSVANFNVNRKPFIRGLEVKKRGTSEILKKVYDRQIIKRSLDITNLQNLAELVYDAIDYFYSANWNIEDFVKTAVFKPISAKEIAEGKGNKSVLLFVDRMNRRGIQIKPYERFKYVIVKKYPISFDYKGRKVPLKVGDRMELLENARSMEIDHNYYMDGNILTQLARILIYHKKFNLVSDNTPEESIKKLIETMVKNARKHLQVFMKYKSYSSEYHNIGVFKKKIFRKADEIIRGIITEDTFTDSVFIDWKVDFDKNFDKLVKIANISAGKRYKGYGEKYMRFMRLNAGKTIETLIYESEYVYSHMRKYYKNFRILQLNELKGELRNIFAKIWKVNDKYIEIVRVISNEIEKHISEKIEKLMNPIGNKGISLVEFKKMSGMSLSELADGKIKWAKIRETCRPLIKELLNDDEVKNVNSEFRKINFEIKKIVAIYYKFVSVDSYMKSWKMIKHRNISASKTHIDNKKSEILDEVNNTVSIDDISVCEHL